MHFVKRSRLAFVIGAFAVLRLVGSTPAIAADFRTYGLSTYAVLLEIKNSDPGGRLDAGSIKTIAAADASLDVDRVTRASPDDTLCRASDNAAGSPATVFHAFVAPSYENMPLPILRDFVRSSLVALTRAVNAKLADPAASADAKNAALGQYFHFVQAIFLNQDDQNGRPFVLGPSDAAMEAVGRARRARDPVPDVALRALAALFEAGKVLSRTGRVPDVAAAAQFDNDFYAALSPAARKTLLTKLQQAGLAIDAEALAPLFRDPRPSSDPADGWVTARSALTAGWDRAHPKSAVPFSPPDAATSQGADAIDYAAHPGWIASTTLRQEADAERRPIDGLALLIQAQGALRVQIDGVTRALAGEKDAPRRARMAVTLQGLQSALTASNGAAQADAAARPTPDAQRARSTALAALRQSLQDAAQLQADFGFNSTPAAAPCIAPTTIALPPALSDVVATAVAAAVRKGDAVSDDIRHRCADVSADALMSLFTGETVAVAPECRPMVRQSRVELASYARWHLVKTDPALEDLLRPFAQDEGPRP